ncbi:hypothetical protein ACLB2K_006179 [Fragaria x ananassa]
MLSQFSGLDSLSDRVSLVDLRKLVHGVDSSLPSLFSLVLNEFVLLDFIGSGLSVVIPSFRHISRPLGPWRRRRQQQWQGFAWAAAAVLDNYG